MFIVAEHFVHLPLENIYESIGIRSYHFSSFLQLSQWDGLINILGYLYSLSSLYIRAFKKLANTSPSSKKNMYRIICIFYYT
jgi:hypothetical protein